MELPIVSFGDSSCKVLGFRFSKYLNNDRLAVLVALKWDDGFIENQTVSVNLVDESNQLLLKETQFFAKNWSEGEPLFNTLVASKWIVPTGWLGSSGFVRPPVCEVGPDAIILPE